MAKKKTAKKSSKKGIAIAAAALLAIGAVSPSEKEEPKKEPVVSEIVIQQETSAPENSQFIPNKQVSPAPTSQNTITTYVGSDESDKYHEPGCRWAKEIKEENLIYFHSSEEAKAAGYKSCGTCHPK